MITSSVEAIHPATVNQQGYVLASLTDPQAQLYVEQAVIHLGGSIDDSRFRQTWKLLLQQHSILRTALVWDLEDEPRQVVHRSPKIPLEIVDAREWDEAGQDQHIVDVLAQHRRKIFDFSTPPLLRLALQHRSDNEHVLVWTHHHSILDGWSHLQLIRDMVDQYNSPTAAPAKGQDFSSFAAAAATKNRNSHREFWRARLAEFAAPPPLPRHSFEAVEDRHGTIELSIPEDEFERARKFASSSGLTVATLIIGCWGLVASRLRPASEILIGVTTAGRPASLARSLGPYATTITQRIRIHPDRQFVDWLTELQDDLIAATDFSDCAASEIHTWAGLPPDRPAYDSVVAFSNYPNNLRSRVWNKSSANLGIFVSAIRPYGGRSQYPLTIVVSESAGLTVRVVNDRSRVSDDQALAAGEGLLAVLADLNDLDRPHVLSAAKPARKVAPLETTASPLPPLPHELVPVGSTPRGTILEIVEKSFAAVLGRESISIDADFISLGGHSMMAVALMRQLKSVTGVALTLGDLVHTRTVRATARRIGELLGTAETADPAFTLEVSNRESASPFPLTALQQAYWVGRQSGFELGDVDAHIYAEVDIAGLDVERLEAIWQTLIKRHPMLRAVVNADGQQRVLPHVPDYAIMTTDLRTSPDRDALLTAVRARLSHIRRDVSQWPLFTVEAALLPEQQTRLFLSVDMLIGDAQSWRILYREAVALYAKPDLRLPELDLQFSDYVDALSRLKSGGAYERDRRYWQQRLTHFPKPPALPLLRHSSEQPIPQLFERRTSIYSEANTAALRALAAKHGATLSTLLLAVFSDVLRIHTGSAEFLINVTAYNRPAIHPQINDVVGDFTSLLLLAVSNKGATFADRLRVLQRQIWVDFSHGSYNGVEVLRDLASISRGHTLAAAPVVFTSTVDIGTADDQQPEIVGEVGFGIGQTPQVAFDYQAYIINGALRINWDTVEAWFPKGYLDEMFSEHRKMIEMLVADPSCTNRARLLDRDPVAIPESRPLGGGQRLHQPFLSQWENNPHSIAIRMDNRDLTYDDVYRLALHIASQILAVSPVSPLVPIVMEKGWQQPIAALAILMCGRAFIPLDVSWPSARIASVLANSGADIIVTQDHLTDRLTSQGVGLASLISVDERCTCDNDHEWFLDAAASTQTADDLAYVIYTSGSTGEPKGVMITHQAALNTILSINARYGVNDTDRVFALSPLSFDLAIYDIFGTFAAGGTLVMPSQSELRNPSRWAEILVEESVTVWNSAPALLSLLLEAQRSAALTLPHLRLCLLSGDWIPLKLPASLKWRAPRAHVVSLGGATEASIWSIAFDVSQLDPTWTSIPYGYPLSGQAVFVLDEGLAKQPVGVPGEIFIAGHGLAVGYLNRPDLTAEAFLVAPHTGDRLYRTGDVGRLRADGSIELLGRMDDQVKIGGYRIEPREVEAAIITTPGVASAAVMAIGAAEQRRLIAFYTGTAELGVVRAEVAKRLPAAMIPSRFYMLDMLPLTATGKVDTRGLALLAVNEDTSGHLATMPRATEHEHRAQPDVDLIVEIVCSTLSIVATDNTDLLESGLTSIDLIRLCNAIEQQIGVRPDIEALYRNPTPAAIAERLTGLPAAIHKDRAAPIDARVGSLWTVEKILDDPLDRERFRAQRPRLPRPSQQRTLPERPPLELAQRSRRRSARSFSDSPVTLPQLSDLLDCLRETQTEGGTLRLYPSAGGLYNVSAYVHIRPLRVDLLQAGGLFYYHPREHDLQPVATGFDLDESIHLGRTNLALARMAAFTIFLVSDPRDSVPLYGEHAERLSLLNAGYVGQLLVSRAASTGLGLCPVQGIAEDHIRWMFPDGDRAAVLHTLLGGSLSEDHRIAAEAVSREADA